MVLNKGAQSTQSEMLFSTEEEKWEMKIDTNSISHIIARLTDLYENPVEATVRELISNAIDTTKRLPENERKEIVVTLPTELNREFIVTDLGEGMSYQTIKDIYSQYGASTKSTDMTQIGAYGLGAKAPLSYCSQFTVESTRDGFTTEILISSEMNGNYIRTVSAEQTGRPNGTKVVIPVRESDSDNFVSAAETYHKFALDTEIRFVGHNYGEKPELIYIGDSIVDTDSNGEQIKVRTFASANSIGEIFFDYLNGNIREQPDYLLSGWKYEGDGSRYSYGRRIQLYVELIPGLVDFSSSRDSITRNHRFTHVNKKITEDKSRLLSEFIQRSIEDGSLSDSDCLAQIGKITARNNLSNHQFGSYIKELKNTKGESFYEKVVNQEGSEFLALFYREFYSKQTTVSGFKYGSFSGERVKMTELREQIEANETSVPINSLLSFATSQNNNLVIVTEFEDEIQAKKAIGRTTSYYNLQTAKSDFYFGFTYLTEDELRTSAEELIDLTNAVFMTAEKFFELTKPAKRSASSKNGTDVVTVRLNSTVIDSVKSPLNSSYSYSFDSPNYRTKEAIEDTDGYKVLVIKDNLTSYINSRVISKALFNAKMAHPGEDVVAYFITATNMNANNIDFLVEEMDEVVIVEDTHFRSKAVTNKVSEMNVIKNPDKYIIDNASEFGEQLKLVALKDVLLMIRSVLNCSMIEIPKNIDNNFIDKMNNFLNDRKMNYINIDFSQVEFKNKDIESSIDERIELIKNYYLENEYLIDNLHYFTDDLERKDKKPTGLLKTFVSEIIDLVTL